MIEIFLASGELACTTDPIQSDTCNVLIKRAVLDEYGRDNCGAGDAGIVEPKLFWKNDEPASWLFSNLHEGDVVYIGGEVLELRMDETGRIWKLVEF